MLQCRRQKSTNTLCRDSFIKVKLNAYKNMTYQDSTRIFLLFAFNIRRRAVIDETSFPNLQSIRRNPSLGKVLRLIILWLGQLTTEGIHYTTRHLI